ncbi:hypothetical protein SK128_022430, partial [Halocaridina rubra]
TIYLPASSPSKRMPNELVEATLSFTLGPVPSRDQLVLLCCTPTRWIQAPSSPRLTSYYGHGWSPAGPKSRARHAPPPTIRFQQCLPACQTGSSTCRR